MRHEELASLCPSWAGRRAGILRAWFAKRFCGFTPLDAVDLECVVEAAPGCRPAISKMDSGLFRTIACKVFPFTRSVNFAGRGDPLLNEALHWMVRVAKSYGCEVAVTTGATVMDEGKICGLIGAKTDLLIVCIESFDEAGGTAPAVRNLEILSRVKDALAAERPHLVIATALTGHGTPDALIEFARRVKAATIHAVYPRDAGAGIPQADSERWRAHASERGLHLVITGFRKTPCDPRVRIDVTREGKVLPCRALPHGSHVRGEDSPPMGDLTALSLRSILRGRIAS